MKKEHFLHGQLSGKSKDCPVSSSQGDGSNWTDPRWRMPLQEPVNLGRKGVKPCFLTQEMNISPPSYPVKTLGPIVL